MSKKKHRYGCSSALSNSVRTLVILLVATFVCEILYRLGLEDQNIIIIMVLALFLIAAATDRYWYGLLATPIGVLVYDYLVTKPRMGFSVTLGFPITLSIMLIVSLTTNAVTNRIKRQAEDAREKEQRAELLYEINHRLFSSRNESAIAHNALGYLKNDSGRSAALYTNLQDPAQAHLYFIQAEGGAGENFFSSQAEGEKAKLAWETGKPVGQKDSDTAVTWGYYYPVATQGIVYGVFGVSPGEEPLTPARYAFLELISGQTAQALHMQALIAKQQEATVMAEAEKIRNSFLRGISHDFRTPLTSIIGASSTILENREELPASTQLQLIEGIRADSMWLLSILENILSITRIQQNDVSIRRSKEAAEEIVAEAVALFRRNNPKANISIRQAESLLLVPMDALLFTRVIQNLLDNAYRHTGDAGVQVTIEMREEDGFAIFLVSDTGPGIDPELLPQLFTIQPAKEGRGEDVSRGLGIGLSLCKTIVEVHGGWIRASNLPEGGAQFTFALPLSQEERDKNE